MTTTSATNLLAGLSTSQLISSLLTFEPKVADRTLGADERLVRIWIIEEIERRHDVEDAMNAWADGLSELSYVEALIIALPAEVLS